MRTAARPRSLIAILIVVIAAAAALAQVGGGFGFGGRVRLQVQPNAPYDGRFTFVRVNYETAPGGYWYRGLPAWAHGYPIAEQNLMKIMNELSYLGAQRRGDQHAGARRSRAVQVPGCLHHRSRLVDAHRSRGGGAARLHPERRLRHRRRLQGDRRFGSPGLGTVRAEHAARAAGRALRRDAGHASDLPLRSSRSRRWTNFPQAYNAGQPVFRGVFEDNDPEKRLQMIVNYNTDISQYWEWSGRGLRPFDETNEAYKLGVNYIIYGMTH